MGNEQKRSSSEETGIDVADIRVPMFKVVLYNDNYTEFGFVIELVKTVFHRTQAEAEAITMQVHTHGKGVAGEYPREIAEMKVGEVHERAVQAGYPLRAGIES